jgi:hypothetical protein
MNADSSQMLDSTVIPDGASLRRRNEAETTDRVVGRELKPIGILAEGKSNVMLGARTKGLARQQPDRRDVIQVCAYDDLPYILIACRKDEFVG